VRRFRVSSRPPSLLAFFVCAAPAFAKRNPPPRPIDLNVASDKELEELPSVGATTAKAIIEFREKGGKFRRAEDLLVIRGVSETKLQEMRPYITVVSVAPTAKTMALPKTNAPAKTSVASRTPAPVASKAPSS
jgi:competence ComEA-like helix-hairpin-helix protein